MSKYSYVFNEKNDSEVVIMDEEEKEIGKITFAKDPSKNVVRANIEYLPDCEESIEEAFSIIMKIEEKIYEKTGCLLVEWGEPTCYSKFDLDLENLLTTPSVAKR